MHIAEYEKQETILPETRQMMPITPTAAYLTEYLKKVLWIMVVS